MNIGVVLVTFNRLAELKKTVRLYEQQILKPQYILVVDNHSSDGTADFLAAWAEEKSTVAHKVLTLPENTGGSGGFHAGMVAAAELDADWIWLADDDAYPHDDAFSVLSDFTKEYSSQMKNVVALCTQNYAGEQIAVGHRCRVKKTPIGTFEVPVSAQEYTKEYFSLDMYSFVGAVVRKDILRQAGPARKDFFIYADDGEHGLRMRKYGQILCVPKAKVFHKDNNDYTRDATWRDYYATRNILLVSKEYFGSWAFQMRKIRRLLTAMRSGNPEKVKVFRAAIADAKNNVTGLHPVYRPGWQPTKKYPK